MQPNTKMSSGQATFDLKAARQMCDQATFQLTGEDIDEDLKILIDQANMLPAALDEIERQAKRIAELEAALQVEKSAHEETKYADSEVAIQAFSRIAKQRAALKKLGKEKRERGKALVEERARRICHVPGDPVGHWERYEKVVVDDAREQLRLEGKL